MADVKKPCVGCIYYAACGSTNRTMPCKGRVTKSQKKREEKEAKKCRTMSRTV